MDLEKLLKGKTIYRNKDENGAFFVLDADYKNNPDENFHVIVSNADAVLQGYEYITIPNQDLMASGEKIYSPDRVYYFSTLNRGSQGSGPTYSIAIYNAAANAKLAEFSIEDPNQIEIGGWAADSSGVYFSVIPGGMLNDPRRAINKLKVPN